jgi:hypothetical protein
MSNTSVRFSSTTASKKKFLSAFLSTALERDFKFNPKTRPIASKNSTSLPNVGSRIFPMITFSSPNKTCSMLEDSDVLPAPGGPITTVKPRDSSTPVNTRRRLRRTAGNSR